MVVIKDLYFFFVKTVRFEKSKEEKKVYQLFLTE